MLPNINRSHIIDIPRIPCIIIGNKSIQFLNTSTDFVQVQSHRIMKEMVFIYPKVTMRDVAAHAGVSIATVSNVINHTKPVSTDTQSRVLQAIADLNYHPDKTAQGFKTGRKYTIGLIVPNISSSFFASFIAHIESTLQERNYQVLIANTHEDPERETDSIRLLTSGMVDGLIIASSLTDYPQLQPFLAQKKTFPVVFLERSIHNCPFDSVRISDYHAILQNMDYLIANGHRHIGFLYGVTTISPALERLKAYQNALQKHHIPFRESYVKHAPSQTFPAVDTLIQEGCTAIVAATNKVTMDTMMYFLNHDISIQQEIQLSGFFNEDYITANLNSMPLILHPIRELAEQAIQLLFRRMEYPNEPIQSIVLPGRFVPPENDCFRACLSK